MFARLLSVLPLLAVAQPGNSLDSFKNINCGKGGGSADDDPLMKKVEAAVQARKVPQFVSDGCNMQAVLFTESLHNTLHMLYGIGTFDNGVRSFDKDHFETAVMGAAKTAYPNALNSELKAFAAGVSDRIGADEQTKADSTHPAHESWSKLMDLKPCPTTEFTPELAQFQNSFMMALGSPAFQKEVQFDTYLRSNAGCQGECVRLNTNGLLLTKMAHESFSQEMFTEAAQGMLSSCMPTLPDARLKSAATCMYQEMQKENPAIKLFGIPTKPTMQHTSATPPFSWLAAAAACGMAVSAVGMRARPRASAAALQQDSRVLLSEDEVRTATDC